MLRSPAPHSFGSSAARIWRFPPKSLHRSSEINNFFRRDLDSGDSAAAPHSFPAPATLKKTLRGWMTPEQNPLARLASAFGISLTPQMRSFQQTPCLAARLHQMLLCTSENMVQAVTKMRIFTTTLTVHSVFRVLHIYRVGGVYVAQETERN